MALLNHSFRSEHHRTRLRVRVLVCCLLASLLGGPALSQTAKPMPDHQVQAVFLLHLARFVKWPDHTFASPDAPFIIGLAADDEMLASVRAATQDEFADTHPIVCRELRTPADFEGCHLIFVDRKSLPLLAPRLVALQHEPVLKVSDADGFLMLGGHVQFFSRSGRVKLRLDQSNLRNAHLHPSSQLLRVAQVTNDAPVRQRE